MIEYAARSGGLFPPATLDSPCPGCYASRLAEVPSPPRETASKMEQSPKEEYAAAMRLFAGSDVRAREARVLGRVSGAPTGRPRRVLVSRSEPALAGRA